MRTEPHPPLMFYDWFSVLKITQDGPDGPDCSHRLARGMCLWRWGLYGASAVVIIAVVFCDVLPCIPSAALFPAGALSLTFGLFGAGGDGPVSFRIFRLCNYVVGCLASAVGVYFSAMDTDHSGLIAYVLLMLFYSSLVFMAVEATMKPMVDSRDKV